MTVWEELRVELLRLQHAEPSVLLSYPNPHGDDDRPPPYSLRLTASAVGVAEALHERFGDEVVLRVGALPYPPATDTSIFAVQPDDSDASALPDGLTVELSAPLMVRSGEEAQVGLVVANVTGEEVVVNTNGRLVARVVSPSTGMRVGGFSGFSRMPLVRFTVPDGASTQIPLLVGTASFVRELGYTIPPGHWALTVVLKLTDRRRIRTPPMAFEVIP